MFTLCVLESVESSERFTYSSPIIVCALAEGVYATDADKMAVVNSVMLTCRDVHVSSWLALCASLFT